MLDVMRLLGIDYGRKKVGIAVSDEAGAFALPHDVIENNEHLFEHVVSLVKEKHIEGIVLGESVDFKGEKNPIMEHIERFKEKLETALKLPVHFELEALTSKQARELQGTSALTDASAAALILQTYLDKHN